MASHLEIEDGNPVWLSPDIWVVPGQDPEALPGSPIRGQSNFVWARVHNKGTIDFENVRVSVFWADPSTMVLRSTANLIGYAFVDLAVGETKDVLVLTPWVPMPGQPAHVCLLAQAVHPADPLPSPLPDEFQVAQQRQVAQRNVTVVNLLAGGMMILPLTFGAPQRSNGKRINLRIMEDPEGISRQLLDSLGIRDMNPSRSGLVQVQFIPSEKCELQDGSPSIEISLKPGELTATHIQIVAREAFDGYATIHVVQEHEGKMIGGVTYVVISSKENKLRSDLSTSKKEVRS
jgi:hypothetical protein